MRRNPTRASSCSARIDQIVDSTTECDLLCFLDAFSGYHQIKMAVEDVEKTAFLTPCGVYSPAAFNLRVSWTMKACFSVDCRLAFCFIGRTLGHTLR